jgi:murein DD-endopeptidase MepM/ murein hydrolase activator NlpD
MTGMNKLEQVLWDESVEKQKTSGVSLNPDAALQQAIAAAGFNVVASEGRVWYDGEQYAFQPGENLITGERRVYYARVPDWLTISYVSDQSKSNPLDGLELGPLFYRTYVLTSPFDSIRGYGPHEGSDYDILTSLLDSKEPVRCVYDGVVFDVGYSASGYGVYVTVRHERNGSAFYTTYAHLDGAAVEVGDTIKMGDPVGEIGHTGAGGGNYEHVHLVLQVPGYGLSGYYMSDVVDPHPYLSKEYQA